MEARIVASQQRVQTKRYEYKQALERLLEMNPDLTISELAARIDKHPLWVQWKLDDRWPWWEARVLRALVRESGIPWVAKNLEIPSWTVAAIATMKTVFSPFELDDFLDPDYVFEPNIRPRTLREAVAYTGLENIVRVTGLPKDLLLDLTDPIQVMSPYSIENFLCHTYVKPSIEFVQTHVLQRDTLLC